MGSWDINGTDWERLGCLTTIMIFDLVLKRCVSQNGHLNTHDNDHDDYPMNLGVSVFPHKPYPLFSGPIV